MADMERRKAIAAAFHGGRRIRVGDVVTVPTGFKASWLGDPLPEPKKSTEDGKPKT